MRLNPAHIVTVNDFSEETLRELIAALEVSTEFEHLIYRESELDAVWSIAGFALKDEPNAIREAIASAIAQHDVILFMKGTPEAPACGFSARTVAILKSLDQRFAAVDVLPDPRIRQELSALSNWPTSSPSTNSCGCDIVTEMFESGELQEALGLEVAAASEAPAADAEPAPLTIENRL